MVRVVRSSIELGLLSRRLFHFSASVTTAPARWIRRFALCSFARLSIAEEFPALDHAIYLDADTYVLGDIRDAFDVTFGAFNPSQWAALALETELGSRFNYYHSYLRQHPTEARNVYLPQGLNAGVLMMNLTRQRATGFAQFALAYPGRAPMGDQDIVNAYFARQRHELLILPCRLNRRPDSNCAEPAWVEPGVIHGNREAFVRGVSPGGFKKEPPFTDPLFLAAGDLYHLDGLHHSRTEAP